MISSGDAPDLRAPAGALVEVLDASTRFADLTTMRVGGPAQRIVVARSRDELVERANELWRGDEPWLLLGGGSNTVMHDDGYPGTVLLVRSEGIEIVAEESGGASADTVADRAAGTLRLRVQAGHDWDRLVAECVERGWAGIEALSGIPGLAGAAPVQNIGAYGQELSDVLHSIEFLDAETGEASRLSASELELGYRDSVIKRGREGVVLSIDLLLERAGGAEGTGGEAPAAEAATSPVRYAQLATALGVELGERVAIRQIRESVLRLRASKGMVLDPADHDTWSAGSFFMNPIVTESFARELPGRAPRFPIGDPEPEPAVTTFEELAAGQPLRVPLPAPARRVKLSAAWLIEHSGVPRGFRLPGSGAAISSKHTLAITNRGAASADDVAQLARFVVQRVQQEFGVILAPEPNLYGLEL